jgi:hypothetical protein
MMRGPGSPRTRPAVGTAAWRKLHRERMAEIRARKRRARPPECRQCPLPAAVNAKTGKVLTLCLAHLEIDNKRVREAQKAKAANG